MSDESNKEERKEESADSPLPDPLKDLAAKTSKVSKTILEPTDSPLPDNLKDLASKTSKVAKTMLEPEVSGDIAKGGATPDSTMPEHPATPDSARAAVPDAGAKPNYYIPTLTPDPAVSGDAADAPVLPPNLRDLKQKSDKVARTMLDPNALKDVVQRDFTEREEKLAEELKNRPAEPLKTFQPIEKYRPATPCSSSWDKMTGTGNIRFCEQCKSQVYDFTKIEMVEAEETIFQKEGKKKFVLYRRRDGKFLTADCPVGVRGKQTVMVASLVAALLVVGCIFVIATMPPPPPTKNVTADQEATPTQKTGERTEGKMSSDGWVEAPSATSVGKPSNASPNSAAQGPIPAGAQSPGQMSGGSAPAVQGVLEQPAVLAPAPASSGQASNSQPATGHTSGIEPATQPVSEESSMPSPNSAAAPVGRAQAQPPNVVPPDQAPAPMQSSETSPSPPQSTPRPGIWERPR